MWGERVSWWSEPMSRWAAALGIDYVEEKVPIVQHTDEIGQWILQPVGWALRVDATTVLKFSEWVGSDALRDALWWTLSQVKPALPATEHPLVGLYQSYFACSLSHLVEIAMKSSGPNTVLVKRQISSDIELGPGSHGEYPGYLFLITSRTSYTDESDAAQIALLSVVQDVVAAIVGDVWWKSLGNGRDFLVYASSRQIDDAFEDTYDLGPKDHVADSMTRLKTLANLLIAAIAEDALVDVRIAVSKRLQGPSAFVSAFASASLVTRLSGGMQSSAAVFGDEPFSLWMALASEEAKQSFMSMVVERAQVAIEDWPPDWIELVGGVIAANLNISEAARHLFLHRNTLISRVERLHEVTGFDVRQVRDAMVLFYAGLIVS